jgi:hydroxymethylbilane synthase
VKLRVGTRRSRLARTQTEQACETLAAALPDVTCELVPIQTTGDRIVDRPLREAGGKGLFVKELDEALLRGEVDCAVHSLKDVPTELPAGISLAAVPRRHDARDLLITLDGWSLDDLPDGAVVGTTSLRRAAQLKLRRPGVGVALLRGNVETRLRRIVEGDFAATFLAAAGIARLGIDLSPARATALDSFEFVPAPGQGALGFTARAGDQAVIDALRSIEAPASRAAVEAERALARVLGGGCDLPVGAYAEVGDARLRLVAVVAAPDGADVVRDEVAGAATDATFLGSDLGRRLLAAGADRIVAAVGGVR